jgi:hypothetical protein
MPSSAPSHLGVIAVAALLVSSACTVANSEAGWALVGRVPGTIGGAAQVEVLPAKPLALLVVLMVVVGVVASLRGFQPSRLVAGAVSGHRTRRRRATDGDGVAAVRRTAPAQHHGRVLPRRLRDLAGAAVRVISNPLPDGYPVAPERLGTRSRRAFLSSLPSAVNGRASSNVTVAIGASTDARSSSPLTSRATTNA